GANNGAVDIAGTLNPGNVGGAGTFTAGAGVIFESGGTLTVDLSATNTASGGVNDLLSVTGDLNATNNTISVNAIQGRLQAGTYRVANYSGGLPGGGFSSASPVGSSRYTFAVDNSISGQVNLTVSGSSADLKWASTTSSACDVANNFNWINL